MHVREAGKKEDLFKELTNFEIKISLFDEPEFDVEPKWDVAERFKDILYKEYPDLFKGKKPGKLGKKADLMGIILQESLQNEECSLGTRARYLGWKKTSRGAVSVNISKLKDLGFLDKDKKISPQIFLRIHSAILIDVFKLCKHLQFLQMLLQSLKYDIKSLMDKPFEFTRFEFANATELAVHLAYLLSLTKNGEDIYLILRRGHTWESEGVGDVLRSILAKAIKLNSLKLRVITSPQMSSELQGFFKKLGEVIIWEELENFPVRYLIAADYFIQIQVDPEKGEIPPEEIHGAVLPDVDQTQKKYWRKKFEELAKK
jgi:hypothetical protein